MWTQWRQVLIKKNLINSSQLCTAHMLLAIFLGSALCPHAQHWNAQWHVDACFRGIYDLFLNTLSHSQKKDLNGEAHIRIIFFFARIILFLHKSKWFEWIIRVEKWKIYFLCELFVKKFSSGLKNFNMSWRVERDGNFL